jgi:hypothetical protein
MLELSVIRSGPPEDCDVGNRRLNLGEVLAVLSDECNDAEWTNGRQPHVVQDYVAAHGAQFPAHSKVGQREIEQMTSVPENNVKRSAWSAR